MSTYQCGRNRRRKKSLGHVCVILSSEILKIVCIRNKKTISIRLASTLNLIVFLQDPPQYLNSLFRVHSGRFLSNTRKRKISQNDHSLSLVVTRRSLSFVVILCHLLSLVALLVVTCCTTRCHSLSLVVARCLSFYNRSRKMDVSNGYSLI